MLAIPQTMHLQLLSLQVNVTVAAESQLVRIAAEEQEEETLEAVVVAEVEVVQVEVQVEALVGEVVAVEGLPPQKTHLQTKRSPGALVALMGSRMACRGA